ncbi:unnamed protein product [Urochloa humidicola]
MDREGLYGGGRIVVQDFHRPQHGQRQMECFSDEVSSRDGEEDANGDGSGGPPAAVSGGGDGAATTVETATGKRRRGRPPGSKNKPKPAPVVTRDVDPAAAMRPHVLEVPAGGDVARALASFSRRRGLGICVLAGTGSVTDVSLRHPSSSMAGDGGASTAATAAVVFRGRYEILSISATFLAPSMMAEAAAAARAAAARDLSVSLAGPHGQIVGGAVAGPLVAATTVVILAAAFTDLTFHRLPLEDDAAPAASVSGSAAEADEHRRGGGYQPPDDASGELHAHRHSVAPGTQVVAALYGRQSQEVWPPPASAQRPRPPFQ